MLTNFQRFIFVKAANWIGFHFMFDCWYLIVWFVHNESVNVNIVFMEIIENVTNKKMNHLIGIFLSLSISLSLSIKRDFSELKRKSNYIFKWQVDYEIYTHLFGLNGWKLKIRFICLSFVTFSLHLSIQNGWCNTWIDW